MEVYKSQAEIPERYKWDLAAMYPDDAAWEVDLSRVPLLLQELAAYEGKLVNSAATLAAALHAYERAGRLVDKLWQYAARHRDEDMSYGHYQALFDRANGLQGDLEAASAFLRPELLAMWPAMLASFMEPRAGSPRLPPSLRRHPTRETSHPVAPEEALLAQAGITSSSARTIHGMLIDADMPFSTVRDRARQLCADQEPRTSASYAAATAACAGTPTTPSSATTWPIATRWPQPSPPM